MNLEKINIFNEESDCITFCIKNTEILAKINNKTEKISKEEVVSILKKYNLPVEFDININQDIELLVDVRYNRAWIIAENIKVDGKEYKRAKFENIPEHSICFEGSRYYFWDMKKGKSKSFYYKVRVFHKK